MINDTSVASAGSYIRTCRRIRNSKKIATIRDFHQNIWVNPTIYSYPNFGKSYFTSIPLWMHCMTINCCSNADPFFNLNNHSAAIFSEKILLWWVIVMYMHEIVLGKYVIVYSLSLYFFLTQFGSAISFILSPIKSVVQKNVIIVLWGSQDGFLVCQSMPCRDLTWYALNTDETHQIMTWHALTNQEPILTSPEDNMTFFGNINFIGGKIKRK